MSESYSLTQVPGFVRRASDGALIPANDLNNKDSVAYEAWVAAGNIPLPFAQPATPQQQFSAALAAGINTVWTNTGRLNGTYAIDQQMQFNITAESVMILTSGNFTTGSTTRYWPNQANSPMQMNIGQFQAFAMATSIYVNSLYTVLSALEAGQVTTQWPSNLVTINA
jgi:hypothetical protein